jgi:uncharacterized protein (DUF1778 family)
MQFTVTEMESEVIKRAAAILGVSAASFMRSAALAQSLPMEDCRKVVEKWRRN